MRELISQGVPSKEDNKPNDAPHTNLASQVTQEEQQTETVQVEKPTPRKRKGGSGDYRETYFQKVELADRQPLYVSRTTHEKLMRIVTVIGGRKVTVSSYVENILLRHFEQYQDEINTLYESHFLLFIMLIDNCRLRLLHLRRFFLLLLCTLLDIVVFLQYISNQPSLQ